MKLKQLLIASVVTATAYAGQTVSVAPTPSSDCGDWFAGASFGQFVDSDARAFTSESEIDLNMYTFHVGRTLNQQLLGCDLASYLEIGLLEGDANYEGPVDVEIVPITLNLAAERELFAGIKGYATAGIGYAFTNIETGPVSFGDGGFYAQTSLGLSYDVTPNWEIFGGARYLFLDNVEFGQPNTSLDNNVGYELGLRYNF